MLVALTGGGGLVGRMIAPALAAAGHRITPLGRSTGYRLGDSPDLRGHDALIHCAFAHLPGRYRGGEGDDPASFRDLNLRGTTRLFDAATDAGVRRILFLSSRAVHDGYPAGMLLTDDLPPNPANLYGEVKAGAEAWLAGLARCGPVVTSLRATGLYGAVAGHKWTGLMADHLAGRTAAPRIATELHGDDLAGAILLLLAATAPPATVNVSDLILDHHDLLAGVSALTGCRTPLPDRAEAHALRLPSCAALARMGWRPGGAARLQATLPALLAAAASP